MKQACRITISNGDPGRKGQLMHSNFSIHLFGRFTIFKERNKKNYNYLNIYLQSNTRKKLIFIIGYVCIKRKKETLISIKMNQLTKQNENFSCSQFNSNLNYFKDEKNTCIGSTKMKPIILTHTFNTGDIANLKEFSRRRKYDFCQWVNFLCVHRYYERESQF